MENGQPPDPKRQRIHEQPQGWNREHPPPDREGFARPGFQLPPPTPSSRSPGPPRSSVPFAHPLEPSRRHSDHSQYEPDPNRPGSQPRIYNNVIHHSHHSQSYGGPRETMVKRDPSEESVQFRQPPLRNGPDHHERPQLPSYDSGSQHPGVQYRAPPPPPQYHAQNSPHSPLTPAEAFNPPYSAHGLPGPQAQYNSVSYPPASTNAVKRKAQRAAQACDNCRTLKAKCDEGRPSCLSCRDKNIQCAYRDPPPKQQDKTSNDILEGMLELKNMVMTMDKKIDRLERELQGHRQSVRETFKREQSDPDKLPNLTSPPIQEHAHPQASFSSELSAKVAPPLSDSYSTHIPEQQEANKSAELIPDPETEEEESGEPVNVEAKPSIPVNHTTGAAKLLLVAPIRELAKEVIASRRGEKYPMLEEERRGVLRLYGRGEGIDRPPGYERHSLIDYGAESTPSDSGPEAPTPPGEEWGQLGGLTPPGDDSSLRLHIPRGNTIGLEGMPDMSKPTVLRLVDAYKKKINILHPILILAQLEDLVHGFIKSIPEHSAKARHISAMASRGTERTVAGFVSSHPESPGNKRKRSPMSATDPTTELQYIYEFKPGHPFRSISTALVLLVMALGAICEHQGKVPELASDRNGDDQHDSPIIRNGYPRSPMQNSPILSTPKTLPSSPDVNSMHYRSRRGSLEGAPQMPRHRERPKNIDVIPGLSYFAMATDIIGNQLGGNSLQHVHANILAALYHGQLGRILESHSYIFSACRSLETIIKPKLARFKRLKDEAQLPPLKDNPLLIAFWTCLQLESDIIAEVDCPYSGILKYEELMPMPNIHSAVTQDGIDERVMKHYNLQLVLRKHLNLLHGMFYKPPGSELPGDVAPKATEFQTVTAMEMSLTAIRDNFWSDEDQPANNILDARLRAKFYGARVISYRTYITQILELRSPKEGNMAISDHYKSSISVPQLNANASSLDDLDPRYVTFAKEGIKALIMSTTAFHGLGDPGVVRLTVTNIWGTTHAQFGNVLTLLAVYLDPILGSLIDPALLRQLVSRTLRFVEFNAQPRSALYTDFMILKNAARKTNMLDINWSEPDLVSNPHSSFGSNSNGDVHMKYQ